MFLAKFSDSVLKWRQLGLGHWISRVPLYSTEAGPISSDTLSRRLQGWYDQTVSIVPVLDQWVGEGRPIHHGELNGIIKYFKKKSDFVHALEIVEWAIRMKYFDTRPIYTAIRLNLIGRVHGVERAETYFNSLETSLLVLPVYGTLLNCYAQARLLGKAEAVMEEIRKLDDSNTGVYNIMLNLYYRMAKYDELGLLVREMEEKGIDFNEFTYNIMLNAYATASDIEGLEKLLRKMEVDPLVSVDMYTYVAAAKGYIKAGFFENALEVLKKCEHVITRQNRIHGYVVVLTVYATIKKKEDVYRMWNLLRKERKLPSRVYVDVFAALEKLDDLDGMKKIFEEWEETSMYSILLPNHLIHAYCKRGLVKEAELILNKIVESGRKPTASTWCRMASGYCKIGMMEEAVDAMKKALVASFPQWKPDLPTLAACLEHLKKKECTDEMQEMLMLLEKSGKFSAGLRERIHSYLCSSEPISGKREAGTSWLEYM